ncbi:UNVERIFIED_CONTAM: hypothetical protein Sangu_2835300 [Sesamum angustifolium]|uniref:Uncharacterized protein n=1 Tax=Sesamum angustifolium TaxID=2727405 RepID=A0AAW2IQ16_9LAMI
MFGKFDHWHENNLKVRCIVLSLMTNDIQKQYERYDDVWSIMLRMKYLYEVPDRNIRYVTIKPFFRPRMIEGLSIREHGVMMLSLVDKFKNLQADFEREEMYTDVILRSIPPSFDEFIVNYNIKVLDRSLHELINILLVL